MLDSPIGISDMQQMYRRIEVDQPYLNELIRCLNSSSNPYRVNRLSLEIQMKNLWRNLHFESDRSLKRNINYLY